MYTDCIQEFQIMSYAADQLTRDRSFDVADGALELTISTIERLIERYQATQQTRHPQGDDRRYLGQQIKGPRSGDR